MKKPSSKHAVPKAETTTVFQRAVRWLDDNLLLILASFLLAFIPLYPKIPLWSPIEQYIVRVRLEDLLILGTAVVWGIQFLRKKVAWRSPMFWMICAYAAVGAVSLFVAMFVIHTIPLQPLHIGKSLLHYFRYLEYFSLFVILYSAVKKRRDLLIGVAIFALTVFLISAYGYGQRYFYFPVYSTMNREFSKGIRLYLTQYARVQSTFAGHYDMAAYLVIALPLILALAYQVRQRAASTALHWIFWMGMWLLIMSASRTPFAAGIIGLGLVLVATALTQSSWRNKIVFGITRGAVLALCSFVLIFYFGQDLFERLSHVINTMPQVQGVIRTATTTRQMFISDTALAQSPFSQTRLIALLPKGTPPENGYSTDQVAEAIKATEAVASKSDQPPSPVNPIVPSPTPQATAVPAGVYVQVPDEVVIASTSASGEITYTTVKRPRVYSKCSLEKELSLCIRLETLWPRAIEGFFTNPLTGTGYATLTKESVDVFTEADSTDNNFLRTLGETGLLGFITFYGCVAFVMFSAGRNITHRDLIVRGYSIGLLSGSVALLLNAIYIDVFAASKVAQTYWALSGLYLGYLHHDK